MVESETVLVLTERADATADLVVRELHRRGAAVFRCDTAEFPACLTLEARLGETWTGRLSGPRRSVALEDIGSASLRRPTRFRLPAGLSRPERRFAAAEAKWGLGGVLASLPCRWINHPGRIAAAEYKPVQLATAVACGLGVPSTIITNDRDAARGFVAGLADRAVYKTLSTPGVVDGEEAAVVYTTPVDTARVDDPAVTLTAHLLQERVAKGGDVRATVVGHRVFAVAIEVTGDCPRAILDWRADYSSHRYEVTELPAAVHEGLLATMGQLGLCFAAADFVVTPDGQYLFVDLNPNGQWAWLEQATGLPIAAAIADELLAPTR